MPVIECSCGMVMSIAADESRCYCIRCGGLEFRVVNDGVSTPLRNRKSAQLAPTGNYPSAQVLVDACATLANLTKAAVQG